MKDIRHGDSIRVKYFRDTPCFDCATTLVVTGEKHDSISTNHGVGTFNPVSFALADLVLVKEKSNKAYFEVYYAESSGRSNNVLLFGIKLE